MMEHAALVCTDAITTVIWKISRAPRNTTWVCIDVGGKFRKGPCWMHRRANCG